MDRWMHGWTFDASFLWNEESWREDYAVSAKVSVARHFVEIKEKRNEKQKKDRKEWDEARKRGSGDGISCSSILDREFERKSRSRLCHGGWPLIHGFSPKSLAACSRGQWTRFHPGELLEKDSEAGRGRMRGRGTLLPETRRDLKTRARDLS